MKRRNTIIVTATVIASCSALWCSFYTESLSEHLRKQNAGAFDANSFVNGQFAQKDLLVRDAIPLQQLLSALNDDKERLAKEYGKVLGIGSNYFFVVKGEGTIVRNDDNGMVISSEGKEWLIPTVHVFGNLARDASGWFDIDAFPTMTDFNSVSAAVNKYIEEHVLTEEIRKGERQSVVSYCAAIEVNRDYIHGEQGAAPFDRQPLLIPYMLEKK